MAANILFDYFSTTPRRKYYILSSIHLCRALLALGLSENLSVIQNQFYDSPKKNLNSHKNFVTETNFILIQYQSLIGR